MRYVSQIGVVRYVSALAWPMPAARERALDSCKHEIAEDLLRTLTLDRPGPITVRLECIVRDVQEWSDEAQRLYGAPPDSAGSISLKATVVDEP